MAETADVLSPETVHQKFKEHGVTHVIWLPDSETNFLFTLLNADPDLHMVGVGREGNAAAVAAPDTEIDVQEDVAKAFLFDAGVSLSELVDAINAVGATPSDLVAILEALREAGALNAELIVI